MTTEQAANALGVTAGRIRQLVRQGLLRSQKVGRDWLIHREDLERWRRERPDVNKGKRGRPFKAD